MASIKVLRSIVITFLVSIGWHISTAVADPLIQPSFVLGGGYCVPVTPGCVVTPIVSFPYSASFSTNAAGSSVAFSADGSASYGSLGGAVTASLIDPTNSSSAVFVLNAGFTDILTITFGTLTGPGFMAVNATVSGHSSSSGSGVALEAVGISDAGVGAVTIPGDFVVNQTGLVSFPVAIPFQYGVPFNFSFWLVTQALVGSGDGSATANFRNTAIITGLEFFDSNMNPIGNPVIASASGAIYTNDGIRPVPEPSTLCLTMTGVLLGVLRKRFNKRLRF